MIRGMETQEGLWKGTTLVVPEPEKASGFSWVTVVWMTVEERRFSAAFEGVDRGFSPGNFPNSRQTLAGGPLLIFSGYPHD